MSLLALRLGIVIAPGAAFALATAAQPSCRKGKPKKRRGSAREVPMADSEAAVSGACRRRPPRWPWGGVTTAGGGIFGDAGLGRRPPRAVQSFKHPEAVPEYFFKKYDRRSGLEGVKAEMTPLQSVRPP